ncbi:MAG TPA: transcriptional regulator [Nitrospiraceae bacterium]|jgi:ArsR family transcriptional regulator|nr:transcriptional regulator [Nitrospiraceae bacterium]
MDGKAYYLELRAKIFKALGHPSRLKMVESLFEGERCVCELQAMVGSDISTISKHLNILKEAGILQDERRGTNIYYSLRMKCVANFLGCVEDFVGQRLEEQIEALGQAKIGTAR